MKIIDKICKVIKKPQLILIHLLFKISPMLNDRLYLKWIFRLYMGRRLDLDNPKTFTEKIQWLKLYNRNPKYTQMVDKYEVKQYVSDIIGEEYIIPTLGVWEKFDDIDFTTLPNQFVLKTTNGGGGGGVIICKDKMSFDTKSTKIRIEKSLKSNLYKTLKEWPYKNIRPRIIAEQYMSDSNGELSDFKFFCFGGVPKVMLYATKRFSDSGVCFDYYDVDFNHLPFEQGGPNSKEKLPKPVSLREMLNISEKLSKELPHVRVDLYNVNGKIYFGELTFYDSSGLEDFSPREWDDIFGEWLVLPEK